MLLYALDYRHYSLAKFLSVFLLLNRITKFVSYSLNDMRSSSSLSYGISLFHNQILCFLKRATYTEISLELRKAA